MVYSYGAVPAPIAPVEGEEQALTQLRLARRLWNVLVMIERVRVARYRRIRRDDVGEQIDSLRERRDAIAQQNKALRQKARSKAPTPELDAELARVCAALGCSRWVRSCCIVLAAVGFGLTKPAVARAQVQLTRAQDSDLVHFPASTKIIAAEWNYFPSGALNVIQIPGADVHPMTWADDGNIYGAHNDPLTHALPIDPRQNWNRTEISQTAGSIDEGSSGLSQAVVTGRGVGNPMTQPENDLSYTIGLVSVGGFLFGTHSGSYNDVAVLNLNGNGQGPFRGIEWSGDHGLSWNRVSQPSFSGYEASAGHLQSLNFVQIGQDAPAADGYIYAITFDVEFAGSLLRIFGAPESRY